MLKYILAFLAIVIIWAGWIGLLLAEVTIGLWLPILLSVLIVVLLVAMVVIRKIRARRAAAQLEKALADQASQHAQTARPDLQADVLEMKAEFEKAIAALKTSKKKDALYALPWQIIIGPPGAGKTTALKNSGLQFPYLSAKTGGAIRGVGGTRNCDWWLTNESIILDTAGRWTTDTEDRDEWFGFLDLIKQFRPKKPLNGIIVAVSISELGGAVEEDITVLAQKIRERVDEAMNRLQMSMPVYVLFTKCDLIPGFVETFGDMSKNDRGQVWGFTVPVARGGSVAEHFNGHFDQLVEQIESKSMVRMGEERHVDTREMIYIFPRQLQALKNNLTAFVSQLFEENVFRETPIYRGAYFTSGTQEGSPIDRVMGQMAEAFGLQGQIPQTPTAQKSYFLRNVFREVVFKDADLAVRSEAEMNRQKRMRYIVAAIVLFIALLLLTLPVFSFVGNSGKLSETEELVTVPPAPSDGAKLLPHRPEKLANLFGRVQELDEGPPLSQRAGMNPNDEIQEPLDNFYGTLMKKQVVRPILDELVNDLNKFGRRYEALHQESPSPQEFDENRRRLKSYLLMTGPREADQPPYDDALVDDLTQDLTNRWAEMLNVEPDGPTGKAMEKQARWYVNRLAEDFENKAGERDRDLVKRARSGLTRLSTVELAVDGFISEFEGRGLDLTLERIVGRRLIGMHSRGKVRAAFTKTVYDASIKDRLSTSVDELTGEPWVLGNLTKRNNNAEEQNRRIEALRREYFKRYIAEWNRFLRSVHVKRPANNDDALKTTQFLTSGEPTPLRSLFTQAKFNTALAPPEDPNKGEDAAKQGIIDRVGKALSKNKFGKVAGGALKGMGQGGLGKIIEPYSEEGVQETFKGFASFGTPLLPTKGQPAQSTDLDVYEEQILYVRNALQTYSDDPSDPDALATKIQEARTKTRGLITEQELGWRPVFEEILWPPIDGTSTSVTKHMAKGTGRSWCVEVYDPWQSSIKGRYPFEPTGYDLSFDDFVAFYGPTGTLWGFYDEVLKRHVKRQGSQFEFNRRFGRTEGRVFQPELLRFLKKSHNITATFFPPGAEAPRVDFDARINPSPRVATQTVSIGGKIIEYHNGPEEWFRFSWPGEDDPGAGASIEIRGADGMHERIEQEGEWGLFHLLERGTVVSSQGSKVFTIVWHLRTHDVDIEIDFRPVRSDTPFFGAAAERTPRLMQLVRSNSADVPRNIVSGAKACPRI